MTELARPCGGRDPGHRWNCRCCLRSDIETFGCPHAQALPRRIRPHRPTTLSASAREPVVVKVKATADKDQSRIVSDPSLKAQKFSDFIASEMP